jgi:hypothetical protein
MIRRILPTLTLVAIFVGVVAFYQSAAVRSRTGADAPLYSTRRYDPYGTAAIRDLLAERGIEVRTLERPNLHPDDHGVLIEVLDSRGERINARQLLEWISKGNTVVQFTRTYTGLMASLKIEATTQPFHTDFETIEAFEEAGVSPDKADFDAVSARVNSLPAGSAELTMWRPMKITPPTTNPFWKTLARTDDRWKTVVAGQFRIGKGKFILIGAPEPAINGMLESGNNLDFLLSLVGNGPVLLDEWSHGLGKEPTIMGLIHEVGLLPLLFQLGGVVLLYVWSTSGYLQRAHATIVRRRSSAEQIQTLGFLYDRSFNDETTRQRVAAEVRHRLSSALRCSPDDLTAGLKTITNDIRQRMEKLLSQLDTLRDEKSCVQALTVSHELQREVLRERRAIR